MRLSPLVPGDPPASAEVDVIRSILEHNTGFEDPVPWLEYARSHRFERVQATPVPRCPDCGGDPGRRWGQYVYYSTLIRLEECTRCGLIWSNAHLDPGIVRAHFERAYKADEYFLDSRKAIYRHLASVIEELAPPGARVLDIGGARGDLMRAAVGRRPDLAVTVHDVSQVATAWAASKYGFATLTGDADALASHPELYDLVVLSDVLYYEPKLPALWSALDRLIRPGGTIVLRVPNKALLIRLGQIRFRWFHRKARRMLQDRVRYFNREHVFVFRRGYLRSRLRSVGFPRLDFVPSPLLKGRAPRIQSIVFQLATTVHRLTLGTVVLTPGMLVIGRNRR